VTQQETYILREIIVAHPAAAHLVADQQRCPPRYSHEGKMHNPGDELASGRDTEAMVFG